MKLIIKMSVLRKLFMILFLGIMITLISCDKDDDSGSKIPQPPSNVTAINIPGGAEIFYNLSQNDDIILVTTEFSTSDGSIEILRFDVENNPNSLTLSGLSTEKRVLKLYTVNSVGNRSTNVEVEIEPIMTPEVKYLNDIIETIALNPIVSGVSINFSNNDEEKNVVFNLSYKDEAGKWTEHPSVINSKDKNGVIVLEELANSEFNLFLSDENSEISSTRQFTVTPIIESELDKDNFGRAFFPTDVEDQPGTPLENLWNNILGVTSQNYRSRPKNLEGGGSIIFSIDLGAKGQQNLKLTKILVHQITNYQANTYREWTPKKFKIYGSNSPSLDGSWDSWAEIANCESIKPSGLPEGERNAEDYAYAQAGETFKFSEPYVAYRYIRFQITDVWMHTSTFNWQHILLDQITLWGIE